MDMSDRTRATFEFARDSTIQLIGLATGVMALTITFSKDLVGESAECNPMWLLKVGWGCYFVSLLAGVFTLLALTGTLSRGPDALGHGDLYSANNRIPSAIQIISFAFGSFFALLFALLRF